MASFMCQEVAAFADLSSAMRPTHMAEERSAKAAKEGRPRLASDFQASDWLTSEEEFPVAPNTGTLTGVQQGPAAPQFCH